MPTGYTEKVATGEVKEFQDFAVICARAFGATISMRDASLDAGLPEKFEPSPYYKECGERDQAELDRLRSLSIDEARVERDEAEKKRKAARNTLIAKKSHQKSRYEAMLQKVKSWSPPTSDHDQMKEFMIDQLNKSIEGDCFVGGIYSQETPPVKEWLKGSIEKLENDVKTWASFYAQEVNRTKKRNQWISELRRSL